MPTIDFADMPSQLYPTVGLASKDEIIEANFGQEPFLFDIEGELYDILRLQQFYMEMNFKKSKSTSSNFTNKDVTSDVTECKEDWVEHLRNHFGSKPFKCPYCSYTCVNKSMLNSHMKSHTNIYQYRCADCNYATKYCHRLVYFLKIKI